MYFGILKKCASASLKWFLRKSQYWPAIWSSLEMKAWGCKPQEGRNCTHLSLCSFSSFKLSRVLGTEQVQSWIACLLNKGRKLKPLYFHVSHNICTVSCEGGQFTLGSPPQEPGLGGEWRTPTASDANFKGALTLTLRAEQVQGQGLRVRTSLTFAPWVPCLAHCTPGPAKSNLWACFGWV